MMTMTLTRAVIGALTCGFDKERPNNSYCYYK